MKKLIFAAVLVVCTAVCMGCAKSNEINEPGMINDHAPNETLLVNNTPNPAVEFEYEEIEGGVKIKAYNGSGKNVIIPEKIDEKTVVAIGANAFSSNNNFEQVYIGENVTEIDKTAFEGLKNIVIVTSAGSSAHEFAAQNGLNYDLY